MTRFYFVRMLVNIVFDDTQVGLPETLKLIKYTIASTACSQVLAKVDKSVLFGPFLLVNI